MSDTDSAIKVPAWLTEDIFIDILQNEHKNFEKINKFDVKPAVNIGENFMTVLLRATMEIQLNDGSTANSSYVLKVLPADGPMLPLLRNWRVFEKEQCIYNTYIPAFEQLYRDAGKAVRFGPKVFQPKLNDAANVAELVIMEDLRLQQFTNVRRQNGLDLEHTKAVLKKLAQFHAASACYFEKHGPYPDMYMQSLCSIRDEFEEYRYTQCKHFRECLKYYNNAEHLNEKIKTYRKQMPDMFQAYSTVRADEFQVLNHGDFWINNFMLQYDAQNAIQEVYFIDFQTGRYGSPAHDLYYLLLTSTNIDIKLKHFDYFIYYYHQQLLENLKLLNYSKQLPQLRNLHAALFVHGDWALTIVLNVLPVALLDPTEDAHMDNILGETENAADLKKKMYTNLRFIDHIKLLLPWLDNRGLLEYNAYAHETN